MEVVSHSVLLRWTQAEFAKLSVEDPKMSQFLSAEVVSPQLPYVCEARRRSFQLRLHGYLEAALHVRRRI